MKAITIQQAAREDLSSPWPISISEEGEVAHPEKYTGAPATLIGFQEGDAQSVTLFRQAFFAEPQKAKGLTPVFTNLDGDLFALNGAVVDVTENTVAFEKLAA